MKNKILSLILISVILISYPIFASGEEYSEEMSFMSSIGIISRNDDITRQVTKAEFTDMFMRMLYDGYDFSGMAQGGGFADVASEHKYYSTVTAAKSLGVVNGNPEGYFNPDSSVSPIQMIVIAVNGLGYTSFSEASGGYYSGYIAEANKAGITKDVDLNKPNSLGIAAKILYNCLFTDLPEITSVGDEIKIKRGNENILKSKYDISKYDVILSDNGLCSINGKTISDTERVVFEENGGEKTITAFAGNSDIYNHLGARMTVYIRNNSENGRNEIVNYKINKSTSEIFINSKDILNVSSSFIEYGEDKESGASKKINLPSVPPVLVENGIRVAVYDFKKIIPDDGILRIVSNGGKIELIEIFNFNITENGGYGYARNIIVDSFSKADEYINCRFNPKQSIDLKNSDYRFVLNGSKNSFDNLKTGDVVSVAESKETVNGRKIYYLAVSENILSGSAESVTENTVMINGIEYEASSALLSVKPSFTKNIGADEKTYYLDFTGKITYSKDVQTAVKNYAYLINASLKSEGDEVLRIKLMDKFGDVVIKECDSKLSVDGRENVSPAMAYTLLKTRPGGEIESGCFSRPAIIRLNSSGRICEINTENPDYNMSGEKSSYYSSAYFIEYTEEEADDPDALKAAYRNPRVGTMNNSGNCNVDGRFYINGETLIFSVPEIDTYGFDKWSAYSSVKQAQFMQPPLASFAKYYEKPREDSSYGLFDRESFDIYRCYDIQGYDIDPDTGYAGLAVLRGRNDVYWYNSVNYSRYPMYTFLRIADCYDEFEEKIMTRLYYTSDGTDEMSVVFDKDNLLFFHKAIIYGCDAGENPYGYSVKPLQKGDIIRMVQMDGKLQHIERVLRIETVENSFSSIGYPLSPYCPYSSLNINGSLPYDERNIYANFSGNYLIPVGYAGSVTGNRLKILMGNQRVSSVDISDPTSYIEQYYDISGVPIILMELQDNGEYKISSGSVSDIKTTSDNSEKGSIVFLYQYQYDVRHVFVVNKN